MNLRSFLLVLIFSMSAVIVKSQDIVLKGKLTDKDSKAPIEGATVTLIAQKDSLNPITVLSDEKGNFTISGLRVDKYRLITSSIGYDIIMQNLNIQASTKTPLQFSLSKMAKELEDVTVVARNLWGEVSTILLYFLQTSVTSASV